MGKPVVQWRIVSLNPDAHATFYSKLFDWTVSTDNALGDRNVDTGSERGIPGGFWQASPESIPFVQLFVEVDDMEACIRQATEMGAAMAVPPQRLPAG